MKKVVFLFLSIALLAFSISCKDASESSDTQQSKIIPDTPELAIADTHVNSAPQKYVYVTARTGLSLREFDNLKSEKLAIMPYGSKLKVITTEDQPTMTVGGVKGSMDEVEFNHKKGFAFNGYLSDFFPPEPEISAERYAEELKDLFPETKYMESVEGNSIRPINKETILLPTNKWHTAFYVAQQLFDFPRSFDFPNPKGRDLQIIKNKKIKDDSWISELHIERDDNTLQKITYVYKHKKLTSSVSITKEGELMKVEKTEIVE